MRNEDLLMYAALLGGGFLLGRLSAPDKRETTVNVTPLPVPPIPEPVGTGGGPQPSSPLPPLGDAPSGTYAERWEDLPFEVLVYPGGADQTRISPPLGPGEASSAENCSIIAVPEPGWWDRVGTLAERLIDEGERDRDVVVQEIMMRMVPGCADAYTEATEALRDELHDRLRGWLPDIVFPPPPPPTPLTLRNVPRGRRRHRLGVGRRPRRMLR